jgi:hypothetical protein
MHCYFSIGISILCNWIDIWQDGGSINDGSSANKFLLPCFSLSQLNPCFAALSSLKLVNGYNSLNSDPLKD